MLLFDYTREDSEAVLTYEMPPEAQRLVARDLVQGYGCRRVGPDTDAMGAELPWEDVGGHFAFDVTGAAGDSASHINCNSVPRFLVNSFTTTASTFYNRGGPDDPPVGHKYLPVQIVVNARDGPVDVAATANATAGDSPIVQPVGSATFRFHSTRAEEARDWHILMTGVLIGFGAAMVIEAIRPLIERVGRSPQMPSAD